MSETALILQLADLNRRDGDRVGGKNASLGKMIGKLRESGIRVPDRIAKTAAAYWRYVEADELEKPIADQVGKLKDDLSNLHQVGEGCCQSNHNSSPMGGVRPFHRMAHAMRLCHSAKAAERRIL